VNLAINVGDSVVDDAVHVVGIQSAIPEHGISESSRTLMDVLLDCWLNGGLLPVGKNHGTNLTPTFNDAECHSLIATAGSGNPASANVFVHVAGFATDEALINLDLTATTTDLEERAVLHRKADAVEHEPCSLLSDAKGAGNLTRANAVLCSSNHPDGGKPLLQSQRRILKDGSYLGRELTFAVSALALPFTLSPQEGHIGASAGRADNAVWPAMRNHVLKAVIGICEVDDCFLKGVWGFHDGLMLGLLS
jgi:hypothetical protein